MKLALKTAFLLLFYINSFGQNTSYTQKETSILEFRTFFAKNAYRDHELKKTKKTLEECIALLDKDGVFSDLREIQEQIIVEKWPTSKSNSIQGKTAEIIAEAYNRVWRISETYRNNSIDIDSLTPLQVNLLKAIVNYSKIEVSRVDVSARFHASCFAIPTAAINSYFCLLTLMDATEKNNTTNTLVIKANKLLKEVGMQSWTQPIRNDDTDKNVVQVDRFRGHVWWVAGNGLSYRSVFPAAIMMKSIAMVDVLAEVAQKGLSNVSQNTYESAFWTEGMTSDGAGWGHGRQSNIWGYPIAGTANALSLMRVLKGSAWDKKFTDQNKGALLNYIRGSSWYYYKGFAPICVGRTNMLYKPKKTPAKSILLIKSILKSFQASFSQEEIKELNQLKSEIENNNVSMNTYDGGIYAGARYFYNNDDLVQKTDTHYALVNMASIRVNGNESNYLPLMGIIFSQTMGCPYLIKKEMNTIKLKVHGI